MDNPNTSLETLQDIKRMMERSSRFISLSGLSGVSAGICALVGAFVAHMWIVEYFAQRSYYRGESGERYGYVSDPYKFVILAVIVLLAALVTASYFTWRKAQKSNLPLWGPTSKKLIINLAIPLVTGGLFVLGLFYHGLWGFVAPACLIFYGLALVNASKYTLSDIRWLGILEILLGLVNMYYEQFSLYFWALGFGILHIIYGLMMWWKYDKGVNA